MAFDYEDIIKEKQITIDNLVTWIYEHTFSKEEFVEALRECYIDELDIECYLQD